MKASIGSILDAFQSVMAEMIDGYMGSVALVDRAATMQNLKDMAFKMDAFILDNRVIFGDRAKYDELVEVPAILQDTFKNV